VGIHSMPSEWSHHLKWKVHPIRLQEADVAWQMSSHHLAANVKFYYVLEKTDMILMTYRTAP